MSKAANGNHVQTLIALAREKCHSDAELARRLDMRPPTLNQMKKGKRAVSPETIALLCDLLELPGDEAREWAAYAVIENPKNAAIADRLRRAFFGCLVAGVGFLSSTTDAKAIPTGYRTSIDDIYIVAHPWRHWYTLIVKALCKVRSAPRQSHRLPPRTWPRVGERTDSRDCPTGYPGLCCAA